MADKSVTAVDVDPHQGSARSTRATEACLRTLQGPSEAKHCDIPGSRYTWYVLLIFEKNGTQVDSFFSLHLPVDSGLRTSRGGIININSSCLPGLV